MLKACYYELVLIMPFSFWVMLYWFTAKQSVRTYSFFLQWDLKCYFNPPIHLFVSNPDFKCYVFQLIWDRGVKSRSTYQLKFRTSLAGLEKSKTLFIQFFLFFLQISLSVTHVTWSISTLTCLLGAQHFCTELLHFCASLWLRTSAKYVYNNLSSIGDILVLAWGKSNKIWSPNLNF